LICTLSVTGAVFAFVTAVAIGQALAGELQSPVPEGEAYKLTVAAWAGLVDPARRQKPTRAAMPRKPPKRRFDPLFDVRCDPCD
jgi:hypothetical protein